MLLKDLALTIKENEWLATKQKVAGSSPAEHVSQQLLLGGGEPNVIIVLYANKLTETVVL